MTDFLSVKNLTIEYVHGKDVHAAVRDVSFKLKTGHTLGLVGESGCGKSTLALSLMGLLPPEESRIPQGSITFHGKELIGQSAEKWRALRGSDVAMIFQDPFSSLNPVMTIAEQMEEVTTFNQAEKLLSEVQIADPVRILNSYPHQLSGGQRQRIMIAMALANKPSLLIADEPTTALDVTVQAEIMELLKELKKSHKMAMIFVTHNMGLVKDLTDDLAVMFAGKIVELGPTKTVLSKPEHPYTKGLLQCIPTLKPHKGPLPVFQYTE
jgi:ABC-type dipeptide/oligopeptide/nickel transport system ATPase component